MRISKIISTSLLLLMAWSAWGQQAGGDVTVDYNRPRKYIVGGVALYK